MSYQKKTLSISTKKNTGKGLSLFYSLFTFIFLLLSPTLGYTQSSPNGVIDNVNELMEMDTVFVPMSDGTLLATTVALPVFQDSIVTSINIGGTDYTIKIVDIGTQYVVTDSSNITLQSYELPMIFTRTPYNRLGNDEIGFFPFLGYTYAIQDMRGRYGSEGVYFPMYSDSWQKKIYHPTITIPMDITNANAPNNALLHHDGSESVNYLAYNAQRIADVNSDGIVDTILYSNGTMGMFGASALGNSQYQALSDMPFSAPNPLKCIMPIVATNEHFNTTLFHNGVYRNSLVNGWIMGQLADLDDNANSSDTSIYNTVHSSADYGYSNKMDVANDLIDWFVSEKFPTSPSGAYPTSLLRKDLDASMAPVNNQGYSDPNGTVSRYKNLDVPTYNLSGWWDIFVNGQIETFNRIRKANPLLKQRLVIGPWTHQTIGMRDVGDVTYPSNVLSILKVDLDMAPDDILTDSTLLNKLYHSELLSWYRKYLGGEPYFIIPESSQWQDIGIGKIRIPAKNYVVPYYKFLNYLAKKAPLADIPVEIDNGTNITSLTINAPFLDSALIHLSEPISPSTTDVFANRPPISMYITGPTNDPSNANVGNFWLSADSLPFKKGITPDVFYLHQYGLINSAAPTQNEGTLSYIADPNHPVATIGGNNMIIKTPDNSRKSQGAMNLNNHNFKPLTMDRSDVLGFISTPFNDTVTFVGFPKAAIYAKGKTTTYTTAKTNFDIMVRVLDVYPDGREMFVTGGTVNAKSREYAKSISVGDTNENTLLTNIDNDTYYYFKFNLLPLGHTFGKGHQMKILLSSSNYPKYQSNPHVPTNAGEFYRWAPGDTSTYVFNGQTLSAQDAKISYKFYDQHPSYISFPRLHSSYFASTKEEKLTTPKMLIYPNPAKDEVHIFWNTPVKGNIYLYSITGKLLQSAAILKNQSQYQINIQHFSSGVYFVRIPQLGITKKLVVR